MKKIYKSAILFLTGGSIYSVIEVIWRALRGSSPTHWVMFLIGGLLFLLIGGINEVFPFDMPLAEQCLIGAAITTLAEFVFGCILNLWLKMAIWDYSALKWNVLGQICPQFTLAWFLLSGAAILLDDYIRYRLFGEEKPHYKIF